MESRTDRQQDCFSKEESPFPEHDLRLGVEKSSSFEHRNEAREELKHSSGVFHNRMRTSECVVSSRKDASPENDDFISAEEVGILLHPRSDGNDKNSKMYQQEENFIQWLRDHYEYEDGYFVRCLDVLKKYNEGRETLIKYLSQVGRVLKFAFPTARHLRRSLKGGKREWIYHNLRPKRYTQDNLWHGPCQPIADNEAFSEHDGKQIPIRNFSLDQNYLYSEVDCCVSPDDNGDDFSSLPYFQSRINLVNGKSVHVEIASPRSEECKLLPSKPNSVSFTATPKTYSTSCKLENDTFVQDGASDEFDSSPRILQTQTEQKSQEESHDRIACSVSAITKKETNIRSKSRKLLLEQQISRLKDNILGPTPNFTEKEKENDKAQASHTCPDQVEDLSTCGKEQFDSARKRPAREKASDSANAMFPNKMAKISNINRFSDDDMKRPIKGCMSPMSSNDHNSSSTSDDINLFPNISNKPSYSSFLKSKVRQQKMFPNHLLRSNPGLPGPPLNNRLSYNLPHSSLHDKLGEVLQWEDLSMCGAHRYGWTLTPTLHNDIPSNFIEWILFEGQLLRDGQRVFRELKIYDDWSVSIHAIGRKVFPEDLVGITDLMRTRESVTKVFATLANAKSCHGLPAISLSDLCVRGIVVAKSEIWSTRDNKIEDLRHRAINCQILFQSNEEACPKCIRVVRMHHHNVAAEMKNTGFTERGTPQFGSRPNSSH